MSPTDAAPRPWYREPWPWIIAAGPAAAIVAGIITGVIAFRGADGLVADDYYKRGLAINRELSRDARAQALGLAASVRYDASTQRISVSLAGEADVPEARPPALTLRVVHPSRAEHDRVVVLARSASGEYGAPLQLESGVQRRLLIETPDWRLHGEWQRPLDRPVRLAAPGAPPQ